MVLPKDVAGSDEHRPITELLTPGALYMKNRGAGVPEGKWVRIDTTVLADGNLVTGGVTDPMAAAELLRRARGVTYVGRTELAGVGVRHYRGTADIGSAAGAASSLSKAALNAAADGFRTHAVPFDAYLDDEGRIAEGPSPLHLRGRGTGGDGRLDDAPVRLRDTGHRGAAEPGGPLHGRDPAELRRRWRRRPVRR